MHPNRSNRRIHSPEFKTQVLAECRRPGTSVATVAIAHGLNPNVVRKWLAGHGLKRMPTARGTRLGAPAPYAQRVRGLRGKTSVTCSWLHLLKSWSLLNSRGDSVGQ